MSILNIKKLEVKHTFFTIVSNNERQVGKIIVLKSLDQVSKNGYLGNSE